MHTWISIRWIKAAMMGNILIGNLSHFYMGLLIAYNGVHTLHMCWDMTPTSHWAGSKVIRVKCQIQTLCSSGSPKLVEELLIGNLVWVITDSGGNPQIPRTHAHTMVHERHDIRIHITLHITYCISNTRRVSFIWINIDLQPVLIGIARYFLLGSHI